MSLNTDKHIKNKYRNEIVENLKKRDESGFQIFTATYLEPNHLRLCNNITYKPLPLYC